MRKAVVVAGLFVMLVLSMSAVNAGDGPSFDMKWYGYVKLDGAYDQTRTSHGNFVMYVRPGDDNSQFNMTANQTRFGFNGTGSGYGKATVNAKVEVDLYGNGAAENKPALLIRHAYFTVQSGNTKLLAGQSWDLVSPLNPPTLNYSVLWGCGNAQYRRPQISLWQTFGNDNTKATLATGFFRNMGSDIIELSLATAGEAADGEDDGTDAAIPSVQGLLDINHKLASGAKIRFGASGLWGQLKAESNAGHSSNYSSWMAGGHFMFSLPSGAGFATEAYTGSNTGTYLGGILNASTTEGVGATGAWASAWMKATPKLKLAAGFGIDQVNKDDINDNDRQNNQCVFANFNYTLVPGATMGLELSQWQTEYKNVDTYSSFRAQTAFTFSF